MASNWPHFIEKQPDMGPSRADNIASPQVVWSTSNQIKLFILINSRPQAWFVGIFYIMSHEPVKNEHDQLRAFKIIGSQVCLFIMMSWQTADMLAVDMIFWLFSWVELNWGLVHVCEPHTYNKSVNHVLTCVLTFL